MDATAAANYAKSIGWNGDTKRLAECVSKGIGVGSWTVTQDGWARVGRYAAGKASARVQANKIRKRHDNLETKVIGTDGDWKAEVWVRMRGTS